MNGGPDCELSDAAREGLRYVAELLASDFTGTLILVVHEGGIRKVEQTTTWRPVKRAS